MNLEEIVDCMLLNENDKRNSADPNGASYQTS